MTTVDGSIRDISGGFSAICRYAIGPLGCIQVQLTSWTQYWIEHRLLHMFLLTYDIAQVASSDITQHHVRPLTALHLVGCLHSALKRLPFPDQVTIPTLEPFRPRN